MKNIMIYGLSEGLGGVETIILSLLKNLVSRYKFTIVLSDKENCQYKDRIPSEVSLVDVTPWGISPSKFRSEFCSLLNDFNCDYLWINACVTSNKDIIKAMQGAKNPPRLITHSHGTNYEYDGLIKTFVVKTLHYLNRGLYNRTADLKWACSLRAAKWFYGSKNSKNTTIVKNGIDTKIFKYDPSLRKALRKKFNCGDAFVVLHIGRLSPVKNQSYLLKVFHELCKIKPNSILFIAGTGELGAQLKSEAEELGIKDKVCFLGQYNNVSELYSLSDVFLLPSLHEGMPLTLVEAQCSGLHCFVSSSISKEVKLTSFLSFISNTESVSVWANQIAKFDYNRNRDLGRQEIIDAGFDINMISYNIAKLIDNV